jgi:hypothetical protein
MEKIRSLLASELVLGTLVAILSILTAVAGYQGSMADGDQTKFNVQGQQMLTDANAEYLTANQMIVYDYTMFDGYYTAETAEKEEYYLSSFSEELTASMNANPDDMFTEAYYDAMYAEANGMFDESDVLFEKADAFNERGDALQFVMMISALGLAFAAWASLLKDESNVRLVFAVFAVGMLIYAVIMYLGVPVVAA